MHVTWTALFVLRLLSVYSFSSLAARHRQESTFAGEGDSSVHFRWLDWPRRQR